ncbi:hypothetical protein, partial [Paraglaciecola sp.]|uniref:hypothetical protein n=1 Tax=Paraglaciecola sp. TaxID=1920173 RepID=UPI003EF76B3C
MTVNKLGNREARYIHLALRSWKVSGRKGPGLNIFRTFILIIVVHLSACSILPTRNADYSVIEEHSLSHELTETSGLFCSGINQAITLNDSGNEPIIYTISREGHIVTKQHLPLKNMDWEALTGNKGYLFIGDIGNNSGKRPFVQVHKITKEPDSQLVNSFNLRYTGNQLNQNQYTSHDYDAESLIFANNQLYLFSKSWASKDLTIYQVSQHQTEQNLTPIKVIKDLPGLITGGDYDALNDRFVLVGYKLKLLGWFEPFITVLDANLNLVKS